VNRQILRPLLKYPKSEILAYAKKQRLVWHEDVSNSSDDYLRNYLRNGFLQRLTAKDSRQMLRHIGEIEKADRIIDKHIAKISQIILNGDTIDRNSFSVLPAGIGDEVVVYWLRQKRLRDIDRKTISRVSNAIRTNRASTTYVVRKNLALAFTAKTAKFKAVV
jgi:tRNA(Ile)-lysidine synthase TilS/MesJ